MIATIIIIALAFTWLLKETDCLRVRLESTEYQRAKTKQTSVKPSIPKETLEPLKPLVFTPLDMPEFTGTLNIICMKGV